MASLAILLHASWKRAETGSSCTSSRPAKVSGWAITTFTMPYLQPGSLLFSLLRDIRKRAWQCCQIKKQTNGTQRINYTPVLFSVFWEVSSLFSVCCNKKGEQRYHFSERTFSILCHKNPKITLKSDQNKLLNYKKSHTSSAASVGKREWGWGERFQFCNRLLPSFQKDGASFLYQQLSAAKQNQWNPALLSNKRRPRINFTPEKSCSI